MIVLSVIIAMLVAALIFVKYVEKRANERNVNMKKYNKCGKKCGKHFYIINEPEEKETEAIEVKKIDDKKRCEENMIKNENIVRVKDYIPDIEIELKYSTEDNFTKNIIYDFNDAYLRYGTVKKLKTVQENLKSKGYRLKIWDAFRPVTAQFKLWEVYPDDTFVANPVTGYSDHSRGNTVDVTMVEMDAKYVKMPSEFDDFSDKAKRNYTDCTEEEKNNIIILEEEMKKQGFIPYINEWWHYSDEDEYPVEKEFNTL